MGYSLHVLLFLTFSSFSYHIADANTAASFSLTDEDQAKIQGDVAFLTNGVSRISIADSWPGDMHVFGKYSYRLATTGTNANFDVWTAARMGDGKICAFAHNRFCNMDDATLQLYDNKRMYKNCIDWISNNSSSSSSPVVGLITSDLKYNEGFTKSSKNSFQTLDDLIGVNFVVILGSSLDDGKVTTLKSFVRQGGGLILCTNSWYIDYLTDIANQFLLEAGLTYQSGRDYSELPIIVNPKPVSEMWKENPWYSSALLIKAIEDNSYTNIDLKGVVQNHTNIIPYVITKTNYDSSIPYIAQYAEAVGWSVICETFSNKFSLTFPVYSNKNFLEYTLMEFITPFKDYCPKTVNNTITKAASIIPGYPSGAREIKTMTVTIPLNYKTDWQSTGIFVWPGSMLQVTVPDYLVNSNYELQIGCHTDNLIGKDKSAYWRWPKVSTYKAIPSSSFNFFTYSGGLIYLNIVEKLNPINQSATITFNGEIVAAPHFVLGKTKESDWAQMISEARAPWSEIESNDIISSVDTKTLKIIKNVTELAQWYDTLMGKFYDFTGQTKSYKQRWVFDVQISVGGAHAGYPIMGDDGYSMDRHDGWTYDLLTIPMNVLETMRYQSDASYWGLYHEIGHNFQRGKWTSSNEGEVTNNIFTIYFEEQYLDGKNQFGRDSQNYSPTERPKTEIEWFLLTSYIDLRHGFGWLAFKNFYHSCLDGKCSNDTTSKPNDIWLMYFSEIVQRDITGHMIEYGKEVSDAAKTYASKFPPWDKKKIIDCKSAIFVNSPCATLSVESDAKFSFSFVTWSRINITEALEITFKGTSEDDPNFEFAYDASIWTVPSFNTSTKTFRMIPKKYIHFDASLSFQLVANNPPFKFSDVNVKNVEISTNKIIHCPERSIDGIIRS